MNEDELFQAVAEIKDEPTAPTPEAGKGRLPEDELFDAVSSMPEQIDLREQGYRHVTREDAERLSQLAESRRTASMPTAEDIPFGGAVFTLSKMKDLLAAQARFKGGKASREDELLLLEAVAESQRDPTFGAKVADLAKSLGSSGVEIGASLATGGAAAGAIMARRGATAGAQAFMRRLVGAGVAITAPEVVPRVLGADGGRWRVNSLQRAMPELDGKLSPEQWQEMERLSDETLPVWLESEAPLWKGLVDQSIEVLSELSGGVLGKIPLIAGARALQAKFMSRLVRSSPEGIQAGMRALSQRAGIDDVLTEMLEERVGAAARAAVPGFAESIEDIVPGWEDAAAEFVAFSIPGLAVGAREAIKAQVKLKLEKARLEKTEQPEGEAGATMEPSAPEASTGASATEGGDPTQATPAAPVEGVAASRPSAAAQAEDAQAFSSAATRALGREARFRAVEPLAGEEQAVADFLGRRGVAVTFVEQEGEAVEGVPDAYWPGPNRAVVRRGASSIAGAAMDEAMHTWESQQAPEVRAAYGEALREIDPRFVGQVANWVARQPIYQGVSPELLAEEQRTNIARFTAGLVMYLDTAQGKADFEAAYAAEPSKFKSVLNALYDWVAERIRLLPQRKQALARARLRVARNEQDIPKVAQRILEALNEIRPAEQRPIEDRGEALGLGPDEFMRDQPQAETASVAAPGAPRPARTKAERQAERERRKEEAKRASRILPGDVVQIRERGTQYTDARGELQTTYTQLNARVLEVLDGGARLRVRVDEGVTRAFQGQRSAAQNRARRRESERVIDRNRVRLIERGTPEPGSVLERRRQEAERFAASLPPAGQPRQFTWGEYFSGQDATAIPTPAETERVPGQRVDVGFEGDRPTGQAAGQAQRATLGTPPDERVTQYLEAANEAMAEPELPRQGTVGRPDLNVPLDTEATRSLARAVDEVRKLDQESIPNEQTHELARAYYAADPDGARAMVEDRLARGEQLSAVDTVIATRVAQDLAARALSAEGNRDDHVDFLRWQNAYRESRASTARSLQIVRGLGLAAQNAMLDVLSLPAPAVRREVRKIHKEAPGILGKRLKARKSKFLASQMGRPAEDPERFAAAFDTQTGRPISQERLDYLQSRLDAIEEAEAERMERAKQALRDAGYDPAKIDHAALLDPNHGWRIRRIVSIAKSTREDKVGEYVLASMLSGIYTHVKNTAGNAANLILAGPVQLTAEAMANTVVRDKASAQWGDVKAWWQGFMHALKPAALNAMRAWRTESPVFELELLRRGVPLDEARQRLDSFDGPAIKNPITGRGLRAISLNLLLASDEYFKTIGAVAWAHALAYRTAKGEGLTGDALALRSAELLNDYTGDLWVESAFKAREGTFQDDGNTFTEQTVNTVLSMRETINDISRNVIGLPAGTLVLPFVRTPLRIASTVIRRSPLQPLTYIGGLSGRYKENTRQLVADFGDTVVALGLMAAVMALVDLEDDEGRPFITGSAPRNKAERDMWYRLGIDPMSVRLGDSYYSYKYIEPMSTTIGVLADSLRRAKETGDMTESVSGVLSGLVEQSKDKTFLRTIGDLQRIAEESSSRTQRALDMVSYSFITTWVPNAIKQPLRAADPLFRESQQPREGESVWYQAARKLPYDALPIGPFAPEPRYDLWGRPVVKPGGTNMATGLLVRLLNPVPKVGDVDSATKMDLALLNYNRRVERGDFGDTERPVYPGAPNRNFTRDGVKHTYSPEEYSEYVRRSGELARQKLEPMVESGRINWLEPTKKDIDMIEREILSARERVRRDIWRERRKQQ